MDAGRLTPVNLDVETICRVCLQSSVDLLHLFDEQNTINGVCLSEMISECTMYMVRRHDEFPHLICYDCMERARNAYNFKKQFEASHRRLLSFLERKSSDSNLDSWNEKSTQTDDCTVYPCEKCDEKFLTYERLREHRTVSHKGTANLCRICLKTFIRIADLKNHIAICHPEIGHVTPNECPMCKKKFTRKDHVTRHIKNVHKVDEQSGKAELEEEDAVECEKLMPTKPKLEVISDFVDRDGDVVSCNGDLDVANPFTNDDDNKPLSKMVTDPVEKRKGKHVDEEPLSVDASKDRRRQMETSGNSTIGRRFKCNECSKDFTRSSHLKRHILSHRQEKPFSCKICEKGFKRPDHLKIHLTKHEDNKSFQCDCCGRSFSRPDLLKRHKEQKHNTRRSGTAEKCELCNKSFTSKNYLKKHMRLHVDKCWKCKLCSVKFETKDSLKEHTKSHKKEKPYLCSECGLRFVRNDYLLIHMRRHNGEKPYKCKYCSKGFPRATDLNVHEKYHTGEKTHICTTCGKGFQRSYNLAVHMRVHTGERPYQCPYCSKNFSQGNDLKAHVRRHTGERFRCDLCGLGFIQIYSLNQHKLIVHGIEMESWKRRVVKITSTDLLQNVSRVRD